MASTQGVLWAASVFVVLFGAGAIYRGWQMLHRRRLDLVSDWDEQPLPNPQRYARTYALVYATAGVVLCLLPALLLLGLPPIIWGLLVGAVVWTWFFVIEVIAAKAGGEKR